MKRYGVPYQGSKNAIAKRIIDFIPPANNFYDLFAGGCAITHCAIESGKWQNFVANDIDGSGIELFVNAVSGKYKNEKRWIGREDFLQLKNTDPYVQACWSFGNNRRNYLYSKEIEPWKKALHFARVFNDDSRLKEFSIDSDGSRADVKAHHKEYKDKYIQWWLRENAYNPAELAKQIEDIKEEVAIEKEKLRGYLVNALKESGLTQAEVDRRLGTQMSGHYFGRSQWLFPTQAEYEKMQGFLPLPLHYNEVVGIYKLKQSLESLESLQSLESLERLQRLQSLQSLESLEGFTLDYQAIRIKPNSVIYCDIPYRQKTGYGQKFDYDRFYKWACEQTQPIFISEYWMPEDKFKCVLEIPHLNRMGKAKNTKSIERLFMPR